MKKLIFTSLITSSFLFGTEPNLSAEVPKEPIKMLPAKESTSSKSFFYLKAIANDSTPTDREQVVPGLGIGYRFVANASALDVSFSDAGGRGFTGTIKSRFQTIPKISYLYYLSPQSEQSLYGGVGVAWGIIRTKDARTFTGIIPSLTLGYEMNRFKNWRTFMELGISQGAVPTKASNPPPGPLGEASIGAGF